MGILLKCKIDIETKRQTRERQKDNKIRSTWEGGALGGVEEGWSRTPPLLLEPVLGGVRSPSVVASPG